MLDDTETILLPVSVKQDTKHNVKAKIPVLDKNCIGVAVSHFRFFCFI